jgi:tryptophan synthase alpha chain
MNKIKSAFKNGKAFMAFITCGDPDLDTTAASVRAAVNNGADLIELGIPFSDPTAEGPVLQEASIRALKGGITTDKAFDLVRGLRRDVDVPMIFTTYANVVFSYGAERFISLCREVGVDGIILPDLPFEEKEEFLPICRKYGVDLISSVTPASGKRIEMIAKEADGFIYVDSCSSASICGEAGNKISSVVEAVRKSTNLPCAVGFGALTPSEAKEAAAGSDGVVVGSAIVELLEKYGANAPIHIGEYVRSVKAAIC